MTRLKFVRLERGIDICGRSSVTELSTDMGVEMSTDGVVLLVRVGAPTREFPNQIFYTHRLPFSRVIDSIDEPPMPVADKPTFDSKMAGAKKR